MESIQKAKAIFDEAFLCKDLDTLVLASALVLMETARKEGKPVMRWAYEPKEEHKDLGEWTITVERVDGDGSA